MGDSLSIILYWLKAIRFVNSLYRNAIDCSILKVDQDEFPRVL